MKCHYIYTETGEKVLIPGCMGTAAMGIEHCTCRFENLPLNLSVNNTMKP